MRNFFDEFEAVDKNNWIEDALKSIKGQNFEILQTNTYEGIKLDPFYTSADLPTQEIIIPSGKGWKNRVIVSGSILSDLEKLTIQAVKSGADSITWSIPANNPDLFKPLLEKFENESFEKCFHFQSYNPQDIEKLISLNFSGNIRNDCLTNYVFQGENINNQWDSIAQSINSSFQKSILVNVAPFHNAGANAIEELAVALSQTVEYLHQLTERGKTASEIFNQIEFSFAMGGNYFMEIAKLRAFKVLVISLQKAFQITEPIALHAETSLWNKSIRDSYNNLLRMTIEAMASIIGGVEAITVHPFNEFFDDTDDFSRRIARNIPIILKEEVHLDKVGDIAKGAYFIENLTHQLAEKAWKLFQTWEETGGYLQAIEQNVIQSKILQTAQIKKQDFEAGKYVLIGVNKYPNLKETFTYSSSTQKTKPHTSFQLLEEQRLANAIEFKNE